MRYVHFLKVPPNKIFINYYKEKQEFTVEKPGRYQLNQVTAVTCQES